MWEHGKDAPPVEFLDDENILATVVPERSTRKSESTRGEAKSKRGESSGHHSLTPVLLSSHDDLHVFYGNVARSPLIAFLATRDYNTP